jgi:phosphoserine phosphatase RsbU/P
MSNINKRKSVFKILLIRILLVVIVLNIAITVFQIYKEVNLRKSNEKLLRQKISNEIVGILNDWNSTTISISTMINNLLDNALEDLIATEVMIDLKKADLKQQLSLHKLDSSYYDLYILENGIVVNTTFGKDLGLNLYSFGNAHKTRLLEILKSGKFVCERFSLEYGTERLKAYAYRATADKKYIVEIGSYSKIADEMMQIFRNRLKRLVSENPNLKSVDFWIDSHAPHSFLNEGFLLDKGDSLLRKSFENKINYSRRIFQNEGVFNAEYIYFPLENPILYNNELVLTIIWDLSDSIKIPIYLTMKRQLAVLLIYICVLVFVLVFAVKKFSLTLKDLLLKTSIIANGNLQERVIVAGNNEFTTLSEQFNNMVDNLEFSQNALVKQKHEIEKINNVLQNQNEKISGQRDELENQRNLLSDQKKELTDSINYAQKIQTAVLPKDDILKELLPEHFVLYKPRDIVSGDFYWIKQIKNFTVIIAADCTGHGVPGAFMSMLGISMLNDIVNKSRFDSAGEILDRLRSKVKHTLNQEGKEHEQKDGMDISLLIFDNNKNDLQYAGAFNPLYIIRNKNQVDVSGIDEFDILEVNDFKLIEIKGDHQPIAIYSNEKNFRTHQIKLCKNDSLYIFSDGYYDQFGGTKGKKLMAKKFKELLLQIQNEPMTRQKEILNDTFIRWKKDIQQIDDVLVIGIKWN